MFEHIMKSRQMYVGLGDGFRVDVTLQQSLLFLEEQMQSFQKMAKLGACQSLKVVFQRGWTFDLPPGSSGLLLYQPDD